MTHPRVKRLLAAAAAIALATAALAQERPASILPPGFGEAPPPTANSQAATPPAGVNSPVSPATEPAPNAPRQASPAAGDEQTDETDALTPADVAAAAIPEPPEVPDFARRDPSLVGRLDPIATGLGADPWGGASGAFLERIMRRTNGALPSRWLHMALRNALLSRAPAPYAVNPADWVAERSWLLLRMGEADAARMLVSGVDVRDFTPKMTQVAVQSALANADPAGLCPLRDGVADVEPRVAPLVAAICSSLSGNAEAAASDLENVRRSRQLGGVDLSLANKLIGAGADSRRSITIDWDAVPQLNSWRFGLGTATGIVIPDRLFGAATPQFRAWQARAPMLAVDQRLDAGRIAAGMGVFSGQSLADLYAGVYDRTDPDELSQSDAWQLRLAFLGRDQRARIAAMRKLWGKAGDDSLQREGVRAMLGIAASRIQPDAALADDAPNLIASMLAAGMDQAAARWTTAVAAMDGPTQDRCWAMLALGAPTAAGLDIGYDRVNAFVGRDDSRGKRRSALLVAGLAALGRLDGQAGGRLSARYGFALDRRNEWTNLIDGAVKRGQGGTATVLAGLAFHTDQWNAVPAVYLFHSVRALDATGQGFNARMIAAEALSRS